MPGPIGNRRTPWDDLRAACPDLPTAGVRYTTPDGTAVTGFEVTSAGDGYRWWQRLRALHPTSGLWPLLTESGFAGHGTNRAYDAWDPDEWATWAPPAWERTDDWPEGRWPRADDSALQDDSFPHLFDDRQTARRVQVNLVPAVDGWHVPVVLQFGGFGVSPAPTYHAAALRSWQQRYGAELAAMDGTRLELAVARPPATRSQALDLACEVVEYSEAFDGPSLSHVAARLIDRDAWIPWWD